MRVETTASKKTTAIHAQFQARVAAIVADQNLSEKGKQRRAAKELLAHQALLDALKREHDGVVAGDVERLTHSVFGAEGDAGEFRQAVHLASQLENQGAAESALRRAERMRDSVTATAVFAISQERGYDDVAGQYLSRHPERAESVAELQRYEAAAQDKADRVFSPFRLPIPQGLPRDTTSLQMLAAAPE